MKTSKFSETQIAYILRQAEEGTAIGEVCRTAGFSEVTFYNWRKTYGRLLASEMKRLKKLVADLSLNKAMLQDVIKRKLRRPAGGGR
jgi:putative transposase